VMLDAYVRVARALIAVALRVRPLSLSRVVQRNRGLLLRRLTMILAFGATLPEGLCLHLIMNAYWEPLDFELPAVTHDGGTWRRWIDTALESPNEIVEWRSTAHGRDHGG